MAAQGTSSVSSPNVSPTSVSPPTLPPPSTGISKSLLEAKASSLSPQSLSAGHEDLLPLAVFYGPLDAKNPLLASCEKEIQELLDFMKRKKTLATTEEQKYEFHRLCATSLFNIWTKYAPRLPAAYYNEKLLKVGDRLCEMKEVSEKQGWLNTSSTSVIELVDYYPLLRLNLLDFEYIQEYKLALLQCYGRYLQQFSINFDENKADVNQFKTVFFPKGFGDKTAPHTFHALNGKNICNYQLVCDSDVNLQNKESVIHCLQILSSFRLIMQAFARRALAKIDELRQLELMSSSQPQEESREYYREATIKMPWPRTVTEKLLEELFDSTASRFLAVLESLSDSNRRVLQTGPVFTDEVEVRDVVSELFMAGKELLIMSNIGADGILDFPKAHLLELIIKRKNLISVNAAVKFIKLAFMYEEWSLFESAAGQLLDFLQNAQPDKEIVVDMIMFLWQKCKLGMQRVTVSKNDYAKFTQKISTNKWIYLLWQINEIIHCCKMEDIDVVMVAEITLRLSEILESLGNPRRKFKKFLDVSLRKGTSETFGAPKGSIDILPIIKKKPEEQLFLAYELLDRAIGGINLNCMLTALPNGSSVIDHCYATHNHYVDGDMCKPVTPNNFIMDLHLELIQAQHRIAVVLLDQLQVLQTPTVSKNTSTKGTEKLKKPASPDCFTELSVMNKIRKNKLSKAIYLMQKTLLIFEKDATCSSLQNYLTEAYSLIEKTEAEQSIQYSHQKCVETAKGKKSRVPPPPILLSRTYRSVTLKPAPFVSDVKIPADGKSVFEVKGLETNEKYVFAVAAYCSSGKLIGDAIGETTKPILVYPPLSAVTTRMLLTQVAYQTGNYDLAKKVFSPVWDYFVASPPQGDQSIICLSNIMTITQRRLHSDILTESSSILLYLFLRNIFVTSDIKIKEENFFCDNIKGNEIFPSQQIARLIECERVLVALELSNYLNDSSYALQAVTQCYGLLAPIIYHNIVLVPVVQILRSWKEYDLAVMIINYGKKVLDISSGCKSLFGTTDVEEMQEELYEKDITTELSGAEDPIFLYPIVLNWSVKGAVKEVMKFKQRPRFLEFFTQVMQKCMHDEKFQPMLEITNPVYDFLKRRNESLLGIKKLKYKDTFSKKVIKPVKKYRAAVVEIGKTTEMKPKKKAKKKETLREFLHKNPFISEMPEHERNKRADVRKVAHRFLVENLNPLILSYVKKKRFHQIFLEEMPWKAQMNLYLASAHFNLLLTKLGERTKIKFGSSPIMVSFRSCDPNMFSLYNSGTVLPTGKMTLENYKVLLDFLLTAKKRKAHLPSDAEEFLAFLNSKMSGENVSKTQTVYESDSQSGLSSKEKDRSANVALLDHFMKIFLYCRRAMVLAHRGGYWTLLQNCCRALWNFTQELQILHKQTVDLYKTFPISQDNFLCISVLPFYLGAELLIDMLIELQNTDSIKTIDEKGEFSVPSCYGNIKNDNGGSSLTFEHPLDDVNVVDLKWIHDFVLKSLELVYQVEKWETLVSLAIQFNAVSHERYTEQVTPLLVYAQRQLLLQISKCKGPDISQQACVRYETEYKQKITCRNFVGIQLKINPPTNKGTAIGQRADVLKKLIHSEYSRAKELLCVPVDVTDTLRCFRETLEKSKYHNRSIRHSRKLLSLFLAQTQASFKTFPMNLGDKGGVNNLKLAAGKVEFSLGTEEMHMPTPPDLSQEHFRVFSSVEKSKLPASQLGLVISSYYETINVLKTSNQRSLNVQALHELGNLLIFAQKKRAAFKCWSQALDEIFRKEDVLHTWKELGSSLTNATDGRSPPGSKDYSEELLSKVGIWGCLQGAVISAKIAQFIQTLDVEKRTNCCLLSAFLFQGLLRTTLPHPKAERCYAQYEITQLLPGIELFSDRYRADICSVIASLYYVIRELHFAKQNLVIEVLTDLGFFSEAFHELSQIFYAKNMPSSVPTSYKPTGKMKQFQSFDSGKPLISKENMQSILLTEAEDRLNTLLSEMEHPSHKDLSQCCAGELEIVVEVRLQLAAIALQRHRAAYSAAIVFSTLKLLQDSKLFKKKVVEDDSENCTSPESYVTESKDDNFLDPISLNSREYFNIHLWLRCRLALVTAFVAQIRGIGIVKENDITDYVSLINEVCVEAKAAGDRELQAEFLMQAVIIGLQEKHLKADIIKSLQMITFGETIELPSSNTDYASPLLPLKNIYLPHVMLLAKTKMRIGHTVAKQVYYTSKKKDPSKWLPALHFFEIALKLARTSGTEEHEVEAEIFFQKGKIECQILMEEKPPTMQLESLFEAIQLSLRHDQNSGLIRDSYLEIALLLLHIRKSKSKLPVSPLTTIKVSEAVLAINLLIGKKNARTDKVSQGALSNIPEFASMDLFSSYTDYLLDNYQVVFQTGCTFSYLSEEIHEDVDSQKRNPIKVDITWILLLRYYIHLQRINNMSKLLGVTDASLHSDLSLKSVTSPLYGDSVPSVVVTQAVNKELCFQWYIPPLEKPPKETEPMVLLLYAYNMKPLNISDVASTACNSVVISVHEKLSNLTQIAEISLPTTPKVTSNENLREVEETEEKSIDAEMENMIIVCCNEIVSLFLGDEMATPLSEVPFDVSLPSIFSLERLFDLASGCIISGGSLFNWMVSIIP
ncbi:hypothetical protein MJT46_002382 [Ovis ammon polii x Ovis aries]|nr:hypothetical protein MJT46_002382 [Ovis ammon polii x Ovis aries]